MLRSSLHPSAHKGRTGCALTLRNAASLQKHCSVACKGVKQVRPTYPSMYMCLFVQLAMSDIGHPPLPLSTTPVGTRSQDSLLLAHCVVNVEKKLATLLNVCTFHLTQLPGGGNAPFPPRSIAGLWCRFEKVFSPQIIGIGRQKSEPFGLIELLTFVEGIGSDMCPSPCFTFPCLRVARATCKQRVAQSCACLDLGGWRLLEERHSSNTSVPKCLQLEATTIRRIWHQLKAPCNGLMTVSGKWTICNCRRHFWIFGFRHFRFSSIFWRFGFQLRHA